MPAVRLHSPHSPVALAERLKAALPATMTSGAPAQVTGYGTEARMTLWSHRPNFANSFKSVLSATIEADGGGSVIEGRLGAHAVTRMFLWFWMGLVVMFGAGGVPILILARLPLVMALPMLAIPVAMLAMAGLVWWIGRRSARADEARILDFLKTTIDARPFAEAGR
ncbi:hypothetical protein ACX0GZ_07870 [Sphingomonas aestuarii]